MFDINKLPERIANKITGLTWNYDRVGRSDSTIIIFNKMVLKIEKINRSSENEKILLEWLENKLPVPKIIEAEQQNGFNFLLMTRLSGEMSCSDNSLINMKDTVKALANGLKMLWEIDISSCPCINTIPKKIKQAKYNIDNNFVDMNNFEPETNGYEGFDVPGLYNYLDRNRPVEEYVFSHGDYCLPNVFISGCDVSGFIDCGCGGIADRCQDIALCVRSLRYNHVEYSGYSKSDYERYKKLLFNELGIEPDEEKIRYYILLDELF